nr:contractile injection system protein, VgrG/Pvc8 family [Pseudomonas sp. B33.4]
MPKIIARVLEDRGILADAYSFQLSAEYPQREYCVQYNESDLHFIQRPARVLRGRWLFSWIGSTTEDQFKQRIRQEEYELTMPLPLQKRTDLIYTYVSTREYC